MGGCNHPALHTVEVAKHEGVHDISVGEILFKTVKPGDGVITN